MKKLGLLILCALLGTGAVSASSDEQTPAPALPEGAIHHFDFSGDLCDRITGQPMYISSYSKYGKPKTISRSRLVPDSVQYVDSPEGERTAIRILPMEFIGKLNWADCPQMTVSMLLRFDTEDNKGHNNWISWLETIYYDASGERINHPELKREHRPRKFEGEYHTNGNIDATQNDEGIKLPKDEWIRFTIAVDESAGVRKIYIQDRVETSECELPQDSTLHTNRVGLFQESLPGRIKGSVADVAVYNRMLTDEEVAQIHGVAAFDDFTVFDAYRPLFTLVFVLTVIPVFFCIRRPRKIRRLDTPPTSRGGNDDQALEAVNQAIGIWFQNTGEQNLVNCSETDRLTFRYPRGRVIPKIRKRLLRARDLQPADPEIIRRINVVIDNYNEAIDYRFNGSMIYIVVFFAALFFQEAFQGTRTIFTSHDITLWGSIVNTFAKHWPFMLLLVPYVAFSMGWSLIGHFNKEIELASSGIALRKKRSLGSKIREAASSGAGILKVILSVAGVFLLWCGKTIMWGIRNSTEVVKHFRNGVHVATTTGVNVAMFAAGFLFVAIVIAVIYFILTYAAILVMLSPLAVIPYKIIRNYLLHR